MIREYKAQAKTELEKNYKLYALSSSKQRQRQKKIEIKQMQSF